MAALSECKTERLELRVTPAVKQMLKNAAKIVGSTISDFTVRAGVEAAHRTIASESMIIMNDEQFAWFSEAMDRPAQVKPGLQKLFSEQTELEKAAANGCLDLEALRRRK